MRSLAILSLFVSAAFAANTAFICETFVNNFVSSANPPVLHFPNGQSTPFEAFNLVSWGGMYAPSGDVEGRTAVRNSVDLTSYSIGYELRTAGVAANSAPQPYTMVVGGNAKWHGGSVHPDGSGFPYAGPKEYIFVGSDFTNSDAYLQTDRTGSCPTAGCLNADFDNAQVWYSDLSNAFGALADNANFALATWGTMDVTCNSMSDAQHVISISPADFSTITFWNFFNCNPNSGFIVNIRGSGATVKFAGNTQSFFHNQKTLYNVIPSATTPSVRVEVGVNGNLLAPRSVYNQPGMGVFIGNVFVADVQQVHQINLIFCAAVAPPQHPPSTVHFCVSWETQCAGLDINVDGAYSFRDMNAVVFGDFAADTGDVEGRLAVKGSATFGNGFSIGYELSTFNNQPDNSLPYSLIAGGDVTWGSGALYPQGNGIPYPGLQENMFVGGNFGGPQDLAERRVGGPCGTPGCLDATFDAAYGCYSGFSADLADNAVNVQYTIEWSGLSVTCNDAAAEEYTINLTPEEFALFTYVTLGNCNFQATWTINVVGTSDVELTGDSWPVPPSSTTYNIVGCGRQVYIHDTDVRGNILAPCSDINQPSAVINGKVIARNVIAAHQINQNTNNACGNGNGNVSFPVVPTQTSNSNLATFSNNALRVGDEVNGVEVNGAGVQGPNGYTYSFESAVSVVQGQVIYVTVPATSGRGADKTNTDNNGAAAVTATFATIVALIAAF